MTFTPSSMMRHAIFGILMGGCIQVAVAVDAPVPSRLPLATTTFQPLPLGAIQARGWLQEQLRLQAEGLTGKAETVLPDLGSSNGWLGGDGDDREKAPLWLRGLIGVAWTLDDRALKAKAERWVTAILDRQQEDGHLGPAGNADPWPRFVAGAMLRDWAEATGDNRVVPALMRQALRLADTLPTAPLTGTARARAADQIATCFWLYDRTGDARLLDCAGLLMRQSYDWMGIYAGNRFLCSGIDFHPRHGVDIACGGRQLLVWSRIATDVTPRAAFATGWDHLLRDHGLAFGMYSATEHLAGRSAMQGVELCAIIEALRAHEVGIAATGAAALGDRLETIAFNALPAALGKDLKSHQFYTVANLPTAKRGNHGYAVDYDDGLLPGPHAGCHCCCYSLHAGWPDFIRHAWMATPDGGLAAVAHGPAVVTAIAGGVPVTISATTDYPFGDRITYAVETAQDATFPLLLRIPAWCPAPTITVGGVRIDGVLPGGFHRIERTWRTGDVVTLALPMPLAVARDAIGSATIWRGPLAFALRIDERRQATGPQTDGFGEVELDAASPWNYALDLAAADALAPASAAMPAQPWDAARCPMTIQARARRVPGWTMAWNGRQAFDPPPSPVPTTEPVATVTLVPFGATTLRMASLPVVGSVPASTAFTAGFGSDGLSEWTFHGDAWRIQDGRLMATMGGSGAKALSRGTVFTDLELEADIHLPRDGGGDCGLLFRVGDAAIGCDAFDGYYAGLTPGGQVLLGKGRQERWHPLARSRCVLAADGPQRVRIRAMGPDIAIWVNGSPEPLITVRDTQYTRGVTGVRIFNTAVERTAFDNIRATPLTAPVTP